ncbi:MAG: CDP-diacylglycerol--serine O-phosphatidyltransferase [Euryarchaeota archaeon]
MRLPFNIEIREQDAATIVNLLFGTLAILFLIEDYRANISIAAVFILICVLADGADGYLARTRGQGSLGLQLDSLADFVSFGVLPSILVFFAAREAIGYNRLGYLLFIVSFIYAVSGMLRLARYNVATQETTFYGLPITAGGLIIALYIIAGLPPAGLLLVALILGALMVSDIKYPKVRNVATLAIVGALLIIILLLFALGTGYWIVALVLLPLTILYILNPLFRGYFR